MVTMYSHDNHVIFIYRLVEELMKLSVRDEKGGSCLICDEGDVILCKRDDHVIHLCRCLYKE